VDARTEQVVPPTSRVPSTEGFDLGLAKLATTGPQRARKFASTPAGKPPVVPSTPAVPLEGSLHPRIRAAYQNAQRMAASRWPRCGMRWTILAAIGTVESSNGAHQEGAGVFEESGRIEPPIVGLPLDGRGGRGSIPDSDGGELDGDAVYDRAVGPMQMIPSTWVRHGQDANGDGVADPQSIDDAAAAAASYLCAAAGGSLRDIEALDRAIFSYNHSEDYVFAVRTQLERLDRSFGFGALAPLVTEPPPPAPEAPPAEPPRPETRTPEDPPSSSSPPSTEPPPSSTTVP
jgi:hypothetical protein